MVRNVRRWYRRLIDGTGRSCRADRSVSAAEPASSFDTAFSGWLTLDGDTPDGQASGRYRPGP